MLLLTSKNTDSDANQGKRGRWDIVGSDLLIQFKSWPLADVASEAVLGVVPQPAHNS